MENYTQRLIEQKEALDQDIKDYNDEIFSREELLEDLKQKRNAVRRELKIIEKRLEKLKV